MYPPVGGTLTRTAPSQGAVLGDYKISGGINVATQAWTFQRDPSVWEEPGKFNPDRWLNPTPEMREHFMPFGGSARSCLGQNVARLELLHDVSKFFRDCPGARLAAETTSKSMAPMDFFVFKPTAGKAEITMMER